MKLRHPIEIVFVLLVAVTVLGLGTQSTTGREGSVPPSPQEPGSAQPWSPTQLVQPDELALRLKGPPGSKPLVVCVGFDFLFQSAHVPGAVFYGPGREPAGLRALEEAAKAWPNDREIVIYCGCCPMKQCPNLQPAFRVLKRMGFTHLQLLDLEHDFRQDWLQKGLPVETSSRK